MDFLTAALYCTPTEESDSTLTGVLLTTFDPEDDTSRAKVVYHSVDDLRAKLGSDIKPCGFEYTAEGILLSDTSCRKALDTELATYVGKAFAKEVKAEPGLIDLVLLGASKNFNVVVNMKEHLETGEPLISVPLANFRISNSTLNIYAPYKNSEDEFRSVSLVDIETDSAYPLVLTMEESELDSLSDFGDCNPSQIALPGLADTSRTAVRFEPVFQPAPTLTGEAFCNYLAHNVAYYTLGLKILDSFLAEDKYAPAPREKDTSKRKVPKHNLNIVSTIKTPRVDLVLSMLDQPDKLQNLRAHDAEADITLAWLTAIMSQKGFITAESEEEKMVGACISLKALCKRKLLHFALELLAQRLYLVNLGTCDNSIGPTLKGGGVNGFSVKRTSW